MKTTVKLLSSTCLNYLKSNSEYIANKIKENNTNSWINENFPQPMYNEKKYVIEEFELEDNLNSKDKDIDFKNSVKIYEALKSLPRFILTSENFWLWLHFDKFYNVVRNMMPIKSESTFKDHWLFSGGVRRGLFFGVLSRCYFRVELTVDDSLEDKYELTKWVIANPLRFRNLTWRSFSSQNHLVRGIIKGEKRAFEQLGREDNKVYEEIAKYISFLGSVRLLDVISENDIEDIIFSKVLELMN